MIKKVVGWLVLAFIVFFIAFQPNSASAVAESLGDTIGTMARGFGTFFTNLVT